MKRFLGLCLCIWVGVSGLQAQELTFRPGLLDAENQETAAVAAFWQGYYNALKADYRNKTDTASKCWNTAEREAGVMDITRHSINRELPFYMFGNIVVTNINKTSDGTFLIRNILFQGAPNNSEIDIVFNAVVRKTDQGLRLYNYLGLSKDRLQVEKASHIVYYYPSDYAFDHAAAQQAVSQLENICIAYGLPMKLPIHYVVAENVDEANKLVGFEQTFMSSDLVYAGLFIYPRLILSGRPDHLHELIHAVFIPTYPTAPTLFHEGLATYYAGSSERDYPFHVEALKTILASQEIDFNDYASYHRLMLNNRTNPFYTVGALLIDYALETRGTGKVKALMKYPNSPEGISEAIEKELGIPKTQFNAFIRKQIEKFIPPEKRQ